MMTLIKLISIAIVALAFNSCQINPFSFNSGVRGNGEVVSEQRTLTESFHTIKVSTGIDLFLTQSETPSLSVQSDENIQELIITEVENGTLKIYIDSKTHHVSAKKVMVHLKTIESINSSSGSYVYSTNTLKIPSLNLKSSSGSEMKLSVDTEKLSSRSSSGAVMKLEGYTKDFVGNSSSGSQINASKLMADFCEADASSGANLSVNCLESFNANASSGGHIKNHESSIKTVVNSSSGGHIDTKN